MKQLYPSAIARRIMALVAASALLAAPAATAAQPSANSADNVFAGHYYLSGVREVGSELLLKPDGRFEWMLAYGAVDQAASGTWVRKADSILLTATPHAGNALFRLEPWAAWNQAAQTRLDDLDRDRRETAAIARCPFLQRDSVDSVHPPRLDDDQPHTSAAAAADTLVVATSAKHAAERAIAAAVKASSDPVARTKAAAPALERFRSDETAMEFAYADAQMQRPRLPELVIPDDCKPRPPVPGGTPSESAIAIVVGDPEAGMTLSDVALAFTWSDGTHGAATTNSGGWAFVGRRAGATVTSITIAVDGLDRPAVPLATPGLASGIQRISVDTAMLVGLAFTTMNLKVDGRDLIAPFGANARYSKP